jgi:hypothetical protein
MMIVMAVLVNKVKKPKEIPVVKLENLVLIILHGQGKVINGRKGF